MRRDESKLCAIALVVACLALLGCGSENAAIYDYGRLQIDWKVDDAAYSPPCNDFSVDKSGGAARYDKVVTIRNIGSDGPLCIGVSAVKTGQNNQLSWAASSGRAVDAAACPGAFAALAPNQQLRLTVTYKPEADIAHDGNLTLMIKHNDASMHGGKATANPISLCFRVSNQTATICGLQYEHAFVNASTSQPPVQCFAWRNCGNMPLLFEKALLDPANAQFAIVESPVSGDAIPGNGSPENPKGSVSHKVCVRYTPNDTAGDDQVTLVLKTNDPSAPVRQVQIGANHDSGSYTVSCNTPANSVGYDFRSAITGTEGVCMVVATGQSPLLFTQLQIVADDPIRQADAEAAFVPRVEVPLGAKTTPPQGVVAGDSAYLIVRYVAPGNGVAPPSASLKVSYKQGGAGKSTSFKIVPPDSDLPSAVLSPGGQTPLWLHAAEGKTTTGIAIIGNQGFADLAVLAVCATSDAVQATANVCSLPPSAEFAVNLLDAAGAVKPIGAITLLGWGLQALQVSFKASAAQPTHGGLLHIVYCQGQWSPEKGCTHGKLQIQSISLIGTTAAMSSEPNLVLTVDPSLPLAVGKPMRVLAKVMPALWADHAFTWAVAARPADSWLWLEPTSSGTVAPELDDLVPDRSGTYRLLGSVQLTDSANHVVSVQTALSFTVP